MPPRQRDVDDVFNALNRGQARVHGVPILEAALDYHFPLEMLERLVKEGANTTAIFGEPLLITAVRNYSGAELRPILRFLVERAGQDPDQSQIYRDGTKGTPLGIALLMEKLDAAKELILLGADIDNPLLDKQVTNEVGKEALVKARNLRKGSNVARSRVAEGAIAEYAEAQGLSPAVGPGVGVTFEEELVGKPKVQGPANRPQGGRKTKKSAARHRKKSRRIRRH
jgi:hypothetical protein